MSSAVLLSQALYQGCSVRSSLSPLLLLLLLLLLGTRDTAAVAWFQMELGVGGRHRLLYLPKYYIKHGGGRRETETGLKLKTHLSLFIGGFTCRCWAGVVTGAATAGLISLVRTQGLEYGS